ncbi:non-ribosomal peptide synthetase [Arthroderma uncinatum]|uniref:non-ribosomal peptide synthetase n=1 Tax=Arthroderma uncinatum TaxID=74035 RepID=UPI00144A89E3|nr:non-ribosomal peptide synthetase [Arthroderma uncinatum]KAF3491609.1 non-ribosomal peptide synthetase [Arthroderma uncinatum]
MLSLSVPQSHDELAPHRELHRLLNNGQLATPEHRGISPLEEAQSADHAELDLESQMRLLWARVLAINPDSVGKHDDFFQCGGSAASALHLSQITSDHGLLLTVKDIFQAPRLADLSARARSLTESTDPDSIHPFSLLKPSLDQREARAHAAQLCHVKEPQVLDMFPCTPLQEGMLALTRSNSENYVQQSIYEIDSGIDIERLRAAWDQVAAINPILRTRIVSLPYHGIMQVVLDQGVEWIFEPTLDRYQQRATPEELPMGLGDPLTRFAIVSGDTGQPRFFVWEIHHALYDGWSLPLILGDVEHAYYQEASPELTPLTPFIKYIQELDQISLRRFWTDQFAGLQGTGFPCAGGTTCIEPSPTVLTTMMTLRVSELDWGCSDFTPATIVRAAWAVVMASRTDSNEALYGVTVTGRQAAVPGIERMAGPTIATVPVRVKVDWARGAYSLLEAVQRQAADMIPFEQTGLQNIRRISEAAAIACRFRSLLVIHPAPSENLQPPERPFLAEVAHPPMEGRECSGRYAIDIDCELSSNGVRANMEFDTRLIRKPEMNRIVQEFGDVLRHLAGSSHGQTSLADMVASISSPSTARIADILRWNARVPDPIEECVHRKIEDKALECPRSPAIHAWDGDLTYQQFIETSTRLALQLARMGIAGTLVPLLFEKSLWMPVVVLAVMKAGGTLVALDMKQPKERLIQIVSQTNSPVLLCSEQNKALAQMLGRQHFEVGWSNHHQDTNNQQLIGELPIVHPRDLLYIIFTSGSTGTPKGVRITHRNFCTAIAHQQKALQYSEKSRVIDFASYAFDVTWSNFFLALTAGACICIPSAQERENQLADCLTKYDINFMDSTPSLARALGKDVLSRLTTLILGGEAILPSDAWLAGDHTRVINAYGPAECTPTTLLAPLDATGVRIGRGAGVCTWIVEADDSQQLAPMGAVGELWLEGPLVGDGYLDDAEKTAAAFVQDPIWLVKQVGRHGCVYRTGDLVRYEADGSIVFVGRKDHQVKIRGQRVELGEVESAIRQLVQQAVAHVVVEAIQQTPEATGLTLVAFLTLQEAQTMSEATHSTAVRQITDGLAGRLEELLPSYMVPTVYFPLQEMPVIATGKIDRKRLCAVGQSLLLKARTDIQGEDEIENREKEPLSETQTILQKTWMSVLNLSQEEASIDVPFARLGGDSISAMQVVSQCRMHNLHLTVSDILQARTIRNLAVCCRVDQSQDHASVAELEDEDHLSPFALSPIQRNFFDTYPDGLNHYNQSFLLDLKDPVSVAALKTAMDAIVARHAMLRARFEKSPVTEVWRQKIAENGAELFGFAEHSMTDNAAVCTAAQWRQENLDIQQGPVFACDLFNLPNGNQMILLSAHHLVMDLVSWRILWADLEDHLQHGELRSPQTLSFHSWCAHQAEVGRTLSPLAVLPYSIPQPQLSFWGVPLEDNTFGQCESVDVAFSQDTSSMVFGRSNDSLRTEAVDLILSALFHAFVHTFPERSMPAIWIEGHGREQPSDRPVDISGTVGWFTTLYPLAVPISSDHSLALDVVRLVKDTRRKVPGKGQPFSACRYHSESGRQAFKAHDVPELVFNFSGRFQQLEKENGIFNASSSTPDMDDTMPTITEISKSARRPSMIDIEAGVVDGELKVSFIIHKMMNGDRLRNWISNFKQDLELLSHNLAQSPIGFTLSDLPLLPISYQGLNNLLDQQIPRMGIKSESILDVYPCSPLQEGMLISAAKGAGSYHTHTIWRCVPAEGSVCPLQLEMAWKKVVSRHTVLSSVFALHPEGNGFIQMVLDGPPIRVKQITTESDSPTTALLEMDTPVFTANEPQHMLAICQSSVTGEVAFRLDMDHTLNDAQSVSILLEELAKVYDGSEILPTAPALVDIIRYIHKTPRAQTTAAWVNLLDGIEPCNFPVSSSSATGRMLRETFSEISGPTPIFKANIVDFCKKASILLSSFLQVAWAMTLSYHTGMHHVCFSYLTSGRDAPVAEVERMVGPLANLLISRVDLGAPASLVLRTASERTGKNLAIQNVSIAEVLHRLGLSGERLFNTSLSIRYAAKDEEGPKNGISFQTLDSEDEHEYDLKLSVLVVSGGQADFLIEYREPYVTQRVAQEVYETLRQAIDYLLSIDVDLTDDDPELAASTLVVGSDSRAKSSSLFDQFFAQAGGVEKSIAEDFWKDQFAGIRAGHFPEVKPAASSQIKCDNKVHLTTEDLDLAGGNFAVDVIVRAAWALLTARVSCSDESLFGAILPGSGEAEPIFPSRIVLDWGSSISCLLHKVEQQICEMAPFQRMHLEQISRLSDEAALACNFQTLLIVRSPGDEEDEGQREYNAANKVEEKGWDRYAVVVEVRLEESLATHISIKFDSHIVGADRASRLIHELEHILRQLLDIDRRQSKLSDVTVASKRDLNDIWTWNATLPPTIEGCIHDLILEQAIQRPHFTAISAWDGDLTYGQLHELSSKLAHQLLIKGIGKGSIVPLCFEKSKWMPVAALAVMKAGGASVAVNTALPEQRIQSIVTQVFADSKVKLLLSSVPNSTLCQRLGGDEVLTVGSDLFLPIAPNTPSPQWPTVHPSDTLYVVFTSGTSGNAKGVVITHQNFYSAIAYQRHLLGIDSSSRVFDFASYAFDVVWLNLLKTLTAGGCLCIPSQEERENDLGACLVKYQATVVDLTPSVARIIEPKTVLSKLSTLILGGEAVSPSDLDLVDESTQVVVAYGPAECTPTSAILQLTRHSDGGGIGHGAGMCPWIVDLENPDALAAVGTIGELWLEGPLVGCGYLNNPEKTSKAFIQDPVWLRCGSPGGEQPGRRGTLYRTGDLVRYNEDGSLVFLGRRDTQVKIRGQRVELGDIEHHVRCAIVGSGAVDGTVQVVAELLQLPGMNDRSLVAFVSLEGATVGRESEDYSSFVQKTMAGIREQLEQLLPRYMVPSVYIPIQNIPISPTGKTDRRELHRIGASFTVQGVASLCGSSVDNRRPPQTNTEKLMQSLWAEVLQIDDLDRISANDSFFRIGGDSIAAMRIVAMARYQGLEFTVRDVFQFPVLCDLCSRCQEELKN